GLRFRDPKARGTAVLETVINDQELVREIRFLQQCKSFGLGIVGSWDIAEQYDSTRCTHRAIAGETIPAVPETQLVSAGSISYGPGQDQEPSPGTRHVPDAQSAQIHEEQLGGNYGFGEGELHDRRVILPQHWSTESGEDVAVGNRNALDI